MHSDGFELSSIIAKAGRVIEAIIVTPGIRRECGRRDGGRRQQHMRRDVLIDRALNLATAPHLAEHRREARQLDARLGPRGCVMLAQILS
ncbi:hypothetical protein WM32_25735 [Burkholderia ubonensis]|uniref:hypothetical protein n=1 Tax=Burkholderia ubonensis TaxID=101571 RepID=UPI00075DAEF2|nr:hypothetical protein [Burkholderia ubonensis]KVD02302.1 hypothetical protein WI79_17565 [Burkholderia ubonensis]KVD36196.1 hypothetical protein WI83_11230 [Burkholderia ubonensis]KVD61658.1 hypothetical protein WI88_13825 [Burkholderia ubonensis]KVN50303.1 hypothetical protein WJ64_19310 [Burkholderia ubonensis]KWO81329.1 hypothetical protein WM32_25735 [Burkholderia ubonensis]